MNMDTIYHKRRPDATRNIQEEFNLKNTTVYGGYNLIADFIKAKGLEAILGKCVGIKKADWCTYEFSFILRCLIDGYILGMERTKHFEALEEENLIKEKLGVKKLPDYTTLNKDLKRFKDEGDIEGLKASGMRLIRGSDVHTSAGSVEFMRGIDKKMGQIVKRYKKLKRRGKVLARFDEGFDSEENYKEAEELGWGYVGKVRCFNPLKLNIFGIKRWRKVGGSSRDIEVASITYKAGRWSKGRRVVIIRWQDDGGTQGSFFDELNYNYAAFVTNLNWAEEDIYGFYNNRGTVENRIKEAKYGFGIDKIPTDEFYANYAALQLKMIAYNLVSLFQAEVMDMGTLRMSIRSIRKMFINIAGKLIKRGRQRILKLAEDYIYKDRHLKMREQLASI
ncbi:IS1380 family transposase [hot springs metagenome]|uniref:IS1380 family transposase n=1 Tax=hot springs metagenome TaxID=433727 RepID=A0A5J4KTQ4_9ZZZZ